MGAGIGKESLSNLSDQISNYGSLHCAMIGLDSAGKTTVLYRLKFNQYMNTAPTIGFNCEKIKIGGNNFLVWDVGGQDKLRPLWRSYTRCTDGILFVVDSCKEERLEEAKLELLKISKNNKNIPLLVLANKQDLPEAMSPAKLESVLGLSKELNTTPWHIQATCAITGEGLEEGMAKLYEMIKKKKSISPPSFLSSSSSSSNSNSSSSSSSSSNSSTSASSKTSRKVQRSHSYHH